MVSTASQQQIITGAPRPSRASTSVIATDRDNVIPVQLPSDPVRAMRSLGIPCPGEDGQRQTGHRYEGRAFALLTVFVVIAYALLITRFVLALMRGAL